jgi:uncharacterized protein (TIGR04255 family)
MPFPESPRVIYDPNPLIEVNCELRFPPILKIEAEVPSRFQEAIREHYPHYSEETPGPALGAPEEIEKMFKGIVYPASTLKQHVFTSGDQHWQAVLARERLSLRTNKYQRWEEFRRRFDSIRSAFESCYPPHHYSRIGLRYVDVIGRSKLGVESLPWSELLRPHIAGEFSSTEVEDSIVSTWRKTLIRLDHQGSLVNLQHGLGFTQKGDAKERCFVFDCDYYVAQPCEKSDVANRLNHLNREAGNLFRWCISDRLHNAMRPQPVAE